MAEEYQHQQEQDNLSGMDLCEAWHEENRIDLENKYSSNDYYREYADYIMEHAPGDRIICNGDTLIAAMEDGYLFDDFIDYMEAQDERKK